LRYVINNPQMHIWHHSKELPADSYGVNFGITLSLWDYLFGTVWIPKDGRDIELGFPNVERYPKGFWRQTVAAFFKKS
jgi:sterol desaturase/sphingolipid hydroxylase (fatty acid hydroxylase superfamily)